MICYIHSCAKPCDHCAVAYVLDRAGISLAGPARHHAVHSFGEHTLDNAFSPWEKPYPVTSREELRAMCERQGVYSNYLHESMGWHSGPKRWF